jgi:hypothetical protein
MQYSALVKMPLSLSFFHKKKKRTRFRQLPLLVDFLLHQQAREISIFSVKKREKAAPCACANQHYLKGKKKKNKANN